MARVAQGGDGIQWPTPLEDDEVVGAGDLVLDGFGGGAADGWVGVWDIDGDFADAQRYPELAAEWETSDGTRRRPEAGPVSSALGGCSADG